MRKLESGSNVKRAKEDDSVVINMEWGAFGEKGELKPFLTNFDLQLDKESLHPGKQTYVFFYMIFQYVYCGIKSEILHLDLKRWSLECISESLSE